ncbi:unnamed protein product [Alopecurus aequalis]
MGVVSVPILLCMLLLMPLLSVPGSEAKTCQNESAIYQAFPCSPNACGEACHKEGFTEVDCDIYLVIPSMLHCVCKKEC